MPYINYLIRNYGNENTESRKTIEQQYEPIRIKWDSGYMDIVPPGIFEIAGTRNCISEFRRVIKLSVMSDLTHGTNTLREWRKAINSEFEFQYKVKTIISDRFTSAYNNIVDSAVNQDKRRSSKLKTLIKRKNADIKDLEARKKRVQKCAEILEDMTKKVK